MKWKEELQGVDIYLIDQILKERIKPEDRILDAGCGKGRNLRPFIEENYSFVGIDPEMDRIQYLSEKYPQHSRQFIESSIEDFEDDEGFNVILCNAVLHFAENDSHFKQLFSKLIRLLKPEGILFIRMTSNIGLDPTLFPDTGVYQLPDNTSRYLITMDRITELLKEYNLELLDPVKSTVVEHLRSMTTAVFQKR